MIAIINALFISVQILLTYHHPVPVVTKSGSLTFSEPSGPVQACNGTVLPFFK